MNELPLRVSPIRFIAGSLVGPLDGASPEASGSDRRREPVVLVRSRYDDAESARVGPWRRSLARPSRGGQRERFPENAVGRQMPV